MLKNRYEDFILPMRDYSYSWEDNFIFEAEFHRIDILNNDISVTLTLDDDCYKYDKESGEIYYNGKLLDFDDDEDMCYIGTFEKILKGEGYDYTEIFNKYKNLNPPAYPVEIVHPVK